MSRRPKARRARWRTRVARALFPNLVWSGAGTITRKTYFEFRASGVWVQMGGELQHGWAGTVPPTRWLLVVQDRRGRDHFLGVEAEVWERHDVGDVVTAEHPLIAIS